MALINFRKIGGWTLPNGRTLKKNILFRTGDLSFMSRDEAKDLFEKTRIQTHFDLRVQSEINNDKQNHFFDLIKNVHKVSIDTTDEEFSCIYLPTSTDWAAFYIRVLYKNLLQVRLFLEMLSVDINMPISFGCSVGKDRTGIITAILLGLLEISSDQIIEDYCLSNIGLNDYVHYFDDSKKELGRTREEFRRTFLTVSADTMRLFLLHLQMQEGGIVRLLVGAGLDISVIEELKSKLFE